MSREVQCTEYDFDVSVRIQQAAAFCPLYTPVMLHNEGEQSRIQQQGTEVINPHE